MEQTLLPAVSLVMLWSLMGWMIMLILVMMTHYLLQMKYSQLELGLELQIA